jgi:hypothetical protein
LPEFRRTPNIKLTKGRSRVELESSKRSTN